MEKLYNMYCVVSNKTVRRHEKNYDAKSYFKKNKYVLGKLVKTGRGYFIDGRQVDLKAVALYKECNANPDLAKSYYDSWQAELKRLEELNKAEDGNKEASEA